ncbi:DUF2642 domain-containing protein [Heliobacterium undosum]|uniref:DUF2642 domain-containing protein n=2 Tax=Heliomicrobium undosum TaxID=121734 RepID=A0A845L5W0_9FIRM|nr:DUF2642 domain-containing protein [Heliomicrobium undosum]
MPVAFTPIYTASAVPQPSQYVSLIDPVFIDHVTRHMGQQMTVMTTAGKLEGVLTGVAVDHIQLNIDKDKALHVRIAQIVYFECFSISYR